MQAGFSHRGKWNTVKRLFDKKPISAHLYVTDRCNLDCFYCAEYNNEVPHPPLGELKRWIGKIRQLGCMRLGLQGGEPLLHPDLVEIVRYGTEVGLQTTISTNGFLLTPKLARDLKEAGLRWIQLSVDRMSPVRSTRKSLKTILPKLEYLEEAGLKFHLAGVLFKESLEEARQVLDYGLAHGIPIHTRLLHVGPEGRFGVDPGDREKLEAAIEFQLQQKNRGQKIHGSWHILRYQKALLTGGAPEWTCVAGFKYFFVSAQGKFWLCSMKREPNIDIMDVTPKLLQSYYYKKDCQQGCGVYCVVSKSLSYSHPLKFLSRAALDRLRLGARRLLRRASSGDRAPTTEGRSRRRAIVS